MCSELSFKSLLKHAPSDLVKYIETLKGIDQSTEWHPEGNVFIHTQVVVDRLTKFKDINLSLAGLFHDTGKDRTTSINPKTGQPRSPGHSMYSAQVVWIWRDWITEMGGDVSLITQIVLHHMYIKTMEECKPKNAKMMMASELYKKYLIKFNSVDSGGTNIF